VTAPARPTAARGRDWIEIVATVLLSLAAVATAWSSYQATRWNSETTKASGRVNAVRIQAARADGLARNQTQVDVATFIAWVDARAGENAELESFYEDRFREEFRPAFDAWLATDPLTNVAAPKTPFAMDEYRLDAADEAERLDAEADRFSATVRRNVQRSANYVLGVVLFAVALFFAGMTTKLTGRGPRLSLLIVGAIVFVGALTWIAMSPVSVSV
jgi:ferric-dicitrate binding protein FerR (iron transport regulator)